MNKSITDVHHEHDHEPFHWTPYAVSKAIVFTPIVCLAVFGNLLALFAFLTRRKQMNSPTHYFIANLALSDFLVGLLCLPFLATQTVTNRWYFGQGFCDAYVIMHFWFCSCSIYSTCAICVERYIGVRYPLNHKRIMSTPRVIGIILFIWTYGGFITYASLYFWPDSNQNSFKAECSDYECKANQDIRHVIFSTVFILYIPVLIMIVLYSKIYSIATKHLKVLRSKRLRTKIEMKGGQSQTDQAEDSGVDSVVTAVTADSISDADRDPEKGEGTGPGNGDSSYKAAVSEPEILRKNKSRSWVYSIRMSKMRFSLNNFENSEKRCEVLVRATNSKKHIFLAKRLLLLVGILLLSYVPYYTVFLIRALKPELLSKDVFNVVKWMRYFNSAINPILYAFAVPAYKKAFTNIVARGKFFER